MMSHAPGTNERRRLTGGAMLSLIGGLGMVLTVMLGPTHLNSLVCHPIAFVTGAIAGLGVTVTLCGLARFRF